MGKQHDVKPETKTDTTAELDGAESLERIAVALERLADKFAPVHALRSIAGPRSHLKQCERGHAMQPTDDYCQACEREKRSPKAPPSNDAA